MMANMLQKVTPARPGYRAVSGLSSNEHTNYSCMVIITLSYLRYFELIHLTNKKHTLSNVDYFGVFFFAEDKFRKITEISSSLGTFICCITLLLPQTKLADLMAGNNTMIARNPNTASVQNSTNHGNAFKVLILHSFINTIM